MDDTPVDPNTDGIIPGTDDDDDLKGTLGKDVICTFKGDDTVDGGASNDVIRSGRGTDDIVGSTGDDLLKGKRGEDTLDAMDDDGGDLVRGGRGGDTCTRDEGDRKRSCQKDDTTAASGATASSDQYSAEGAVRSRSNSRSSTGGLLPHDCDRPC